MKIGLAVPNFNNDGGVPMVARFVKDIALWVGLSDRKLVSLLTHAMDLDGVSVAAPSSWLRGAMITAGAWDVWAFTHVGVVGVDFKFQRYNRRRIFEVLADCKVIEFVCGLTA
jgi:hypothetical protein